MKHLGKWANIEDSEVIKVGKLGNLKGVHSEILRNDNEKVNKSGREINQKCECRNNAFYFGSLRNCKIYIWNEAMVERKMMG